MEQTADRIRKEKDPRRWVRVGFELVEEVILAVVIVVLIFAFVFRVVSVRGSSMQPNFYHNDRVVISGILYNIRQGDVVVVVNVLNDPIIKRVIATEGQTVDIDSAAGLVYVDGVALDEALYTENGITRLPQSDSISFPQTVPDGCVFVLGDNRVVSQDSRYTSVGMVDARNILGKVEFQIYPFDQIKRIASPDSE